MELSQIKITSIAWESTVELISFRGACLGNPSLKNLFRDAAHMPIKCSQPFSVISGASAVHLNLSGDGHGNIHRDMYLKWLVPI